MNVRIVRDADGWPTEIQYGDGPPLVLDGTKPVCYAAPVSSRHESAANAALAGRQVCAPGRAPRRHPAGRRCARCGAFLSTFNPSQLCQLHPSHMDGYNPRHDKHLGRRILAYLVAHYPEPVDLRAALGTDDRYGVFCGVRRLRQSGHVIEGCRPRGYRLAELPPADVIADGAQLNLERRSQPR